MLHPAPSTAGNQHSSPTSNPPPPFSSSSTSLRMVSPIDTRLQPTASDSTPMPARDATTRKTSAGLSGMILLDVSSDRSPSTMNTLPLNPSPVFVLHSPADQTSMKIGTDNSNGDDDASVTASASNRPSPTTIVGAPRQPGGRKSPIGGGGDNESACDVIETGKDKSNRSKWGKLRQTVKATTVFAASTAPSNSLTVVDSRARKHRSSHEDASQRDTFLERFSTRHSGCSPALSSSAYHQHHQTRVVSDNGPDSEPEGQVSRHTNCTVSGV